jgi:hypothetical protein
MPRSFDIGHELAKTHNVPGNYIGVKRRLSSLTETHDASGRRR